MALAPTSAGGGAIALEDTIVAIASAPGAGVEGIIRLSGPTVASVLASIVVVRSGSASPFEQPTPTVTYCELRLPTEWRAEPALVPALLYFWPNERSYTRQPLAEIYLTGSPPLLDLAVRNLCRGGARLATPGEFTLRAFLAGRLDLTQAEAVLGVIEARGAADLRVALSQLAGGLAGRLNQLRSQLLDLLAHLEAGLDFVDEDIEFIAREDLHRQLTEAAAVARGITDQIQSRSETSSSLPRVVLLGEPNAGKSSLLNALTGSTAAIVSNIAGTTRDYVVSRLVLGHGPCALLVDTAGVEQVEGVDEIAATAQVLGQGQQVRAALQLLCIDSSQELSEWSRLRLDEATSTPRIVVWTKSDLAGTWTNDTRSSAPGIQTSTAAGEGIEQLRELIGRSLATRDGEASVIAATAVRCQTSLRAASSALVAAVDLAAGQGGEEWIAAELRLALDELGQVTGAVYTDDILDRVFSRFCIGK